MLHVDEGIIGIDADTGKKRLVYGEAGKPEDLVVSDGVLVCSAPYLVRGLDLETGKLLWEFPSESPKPEKIVRRKSIRPRDTGFATYCVVAADGHVFLLEFFISEEKERTATLKAVNLKTGKPSWTRGHPSLAQSYRRYFYYRGRLYFSVPDGILSIDADGTDDDWVQVAHTYSKPKDGKPVTRRGWGEKHRDVWGTGGLIWTRMGGGTSRGTRTWKSIVDPADKPQPYKVWLGLDPADRQGETTDRVRARRRPVAAAVLPGYQHAEFHLLVQQRVR